MLSLSVFNNLKLVKNNCGSLCQSVCRKFHCFLSMDRGGRISLVFGKWCKPCETSLKISIRCKLGMSCSTASDSQSLQFSAQFNHTNSLVHLASQHIFFPLFFTLPEWFLNKRTFVQTLPLTDLSVCTHNKRVKCISCGSDITCSITSWHHALLYSLIPSFHTRPSWNRICPSPLNFTSNFTSNKTADSGSFFTSLY